MLNVKNLKKGDTYKSTETGNKFKVVQENNPIVGHIVEVTNSLGYKGIFPISSKILADDYDNFVKVK